MSDREYGGESISSLRRLCPLSRDVLAGGNVMNAR